MIAVLGQINAAKMKKMGDKLDTLNGVLMNALFFQIASYITDTLSSEYNLLVVLGIAGFIIVYVVTLSVTCELMVEDETCLSEYTRSVVDVIGWCLDKVSYFMSQFVGTTSARYLQGLSPDHGRRQSILVTVVISAPLLFLIGVAHRIYTPYTSRK